MNFDLEEREAALRARALELAAAVAPFAAEADESSTLHTGMRAALRDSSLTRLMVPASLGGEYDTVDPFAVCLVREALMGTSAALDSMFALQGIGSYAITVAGTPEQQATWLPKVASMEAIAALALTEPDVGSDLKGLSTSLTVEGDMIRLNGEKSFISNAGFADFYTVLAREGDGLSAVLVPADTPGVRTEPTAELLAPHVLGELSLDNVILPSSARLGTPGRGLDPVLATLAAFRVSVAGAAVGLADAAVTEAARHAMTRQAFGKPLARLGPVAGLLADSWTDVEMARLITYRAAIRARANPRVALNDSSMAKLAATEAAGRVVDRCVQVMGRFGIIRGGTMERLYRQARPMRIYEGASEVLKVGIARTLCDGLD